MPKLNVTAQGQIGQWVDKKFDRIMRNLSGAPLEATQRTHRWNNHHLKETEVSHLNPKWMVSHTGDEASRKLPGIPILAGALAHIPKYGGWKHYLVLTPDAESVWYVGWCWTGGAGVSRVANKGPARVLVGPDPTKWFGIEAGTNQQIPITMIGEGWIGENDAFSHLPLF